MSLLVFVDIKIVTLYKQGGISYSALLWVSLISPWTTENFTVVLHVTTCYCVYSLHTTNFGFARDCAFLFFFFLNSGSKGSCLICQLLSCESALSFWMSKELQCLNLFFDISYIWCVGNITLLHILCTKNTTCLLLNVDVKLISIHI